DFITIPMLTQTSNFRSLGGSIASLVEWYDLLYIVDIVILIAVFVWTRKSWSSERMKIKKPLLVLAAGVITFAVNLGLAEADRPQLLKRTFDRNYIVKYLGTYNFTIYDGIQSLKSSTQRVLADSSDITEVENYTKNKYAEPNLDLFGFPKRKYIIKNHLASFLYILIYYTLLVEDVTPFLNSLDHLQDKNFTYIHNFLYQTQQVKSVDTELIMDTPLYGL